MKRMVDIFREPAVRARLADAAALALATVLGLAAFTAAARGSAHVGPVSLSLSAAPALRGSTLVDIPPFGDVEAKTHVAPVRLVARVERVDFEGVSAALETDVAGIVGFDPAEAPVRDIAGIVWRMGILGVLAAMSTAGLVAFALRRDVRLAFVAAMTCATLVAGALGVTAQSWDVRAFREPTLTGSLTRLPWLADVFTLRVARIEQLRTQAAKVARDVAGYYADERSIVSGGSLPGTYRVLHVTDLHLDAVGAELARSLARSYEASLVIDTGDAPILGARLESGVLASVMAAGTPRVYIPGNHDSPESIRLIADIPGTTVLTSGTIEVDGLRILAVPDPISRGFGIEPDAEAVEAATLRAVESYDAGLRSGEPTADIVAIHNPAMERPFIGRAQVILSGHTHSGRMYVSGGTVRLNSGTLGGMPYSPQTSGRAPLPHSASVLYFSVESPRTLIAVDRIEVHADRTTTITRRVLDESALP